MQTSSQIHEFTRPASERQRPECSKVQKRAFILQHVQPRALHMACKFMSDVAIHIMQIHERFRYTCMQVDQRFRCAVCKFMSEFATACVQVHGRPHYRVCKTKAYRCACVQIS